MSSAPGRSAIIGYRRAAIPVGSFTGMLQRKSLMLSHITVGITDPDRALTFYGPLMKALGSVMKFSEPRWTGWMQPGKDPLLFIITYL